MPSISNSDRTSISPISAAHPQVSQLMHPDAEPPPDEQLLFKEAFRDFVAGTFYKQMFKALRSTENKPAYFHGGQVEQIFQAQMDQTVAEDLAKTHGGGLADPLFALYRQRFAVPSPAAEIKGLNAAGTDSSG